jgi:sugar phosphate isomerase/epimerase
LNWPAYARGWRDAGFLGVSVFINQPLDASHQEIQEIKQAYRAAGLEIAQTNGWYEALVNPDPSIRKQGILGLEALCRIGKELETSYVYVRPGGLNPNGHWYAHPENHTPATFDRLVDSLSQVARTAEQEGVTLAIEGHVLSMLDTPEVMRTLLEIVNSPALKVNLDPVNFIGCVKDVHNPRPVLVRLFDCLGPYAIAAHAKDCAIEDELVLHIQEVVIGTGSMDYPYFLERFNQFCPDGFVLIEHLPDDKALLARDALMSVVQKHQLPLYWRKPQ